MNFSQKTAGIALAVTAASLLGGCYSNSSKNQVASASTSSVHCYGVNKCGGHNDCKTANNSCKGQASCKGKGFVKLSKHACSEIGGTVGT